MKRAAIMLPKHLRFVECDRDSASAKTGNFAVFLTYATQLLSNGSDITVSDELLSAARV